MKQSLFRNIRRKLLNEGKLVRYLTYAIGEVVLIIVGILFALKINDWNEDRKAQAEFDAYIVQLREDVSVAIDLTEGGAQNGERQVRLAKTILNFLEGTETNAEELEAFERALGSLGKIPSFKMPFGNLRKLLDGNFEAIARNKELTDAAYDIVTEVTRWANIIDSEVGRLEHGEAVFTKFRGLRNIGNEPDDITVGLKYDLDRLRASQDFIYAIHNAAYIAANKHNCYNRIKRILEQFLAVLEEYE